MGLHTFVCKHLGQCAATTPIRDATVFQVSTRFGGNVVAASNTLPAEHPATKLAAWTTSTPVASHLIWRLDDADTLLTSRPKVVEELFGAAGIGMMRPALYTPEVVPGGGNE